MPSKEWADALRVAAKRPYENDAEKRVCLAIIAENCVEAAIEGDMQAVKEIGDRLDGKAHQSGSMTHDVGDNAKAIWEAIAKQHASTDD